MPPWTSFPGAPGLSETLFIEAFGQLTRDTNEPGIVSELVHASDEMARSLKV